MDDLFGIWVEEAQNNFLREKIDGSFYDLLNFFVLWYIEIDSAFKYLIL